MFNTSRYGAFFIAVLAMHWLLPQRFGRPFLLVASYYFYAAAVRTNRLTGELMCRYYGKASRTCLRRTCPSRRGRR